MSASLALEAACPPYDGRVRPVSTTDLTDFSSQAGNGLWMLTVANAGNQSITLDSWRIVLEDQQSCSQ
jgi:subtilisin-like proprotein convertase family protein